LTLDRIMTECTANDGCLFEYPSSLARYTNIIRGTGNSLQQRDHLTFIFSYDEQRHDVEGSVVSTSSQAPPCPCSCTKLLSQLYVIAWLDYFPLIP